MKHIEFEKALLKDGTEINIQQKSIDHLNKLDYELDFNMQIKKINFLQLLMSEI